MSDNTKAMRLNYKADEINTAINKALKSTVVSFSVDDSDRQPGQIYLDKDNRDPDLAYNQYMFREEQPSTSQEIAIWSGTTKEPLFGNGSEENPYEISCGEHLAYILKNAKYFEKENYYKLTADIYLNDVREDGWQANALQWYDEWPTDEALGFCGCFDGNYHTIYGLYLKVSNAQGKPPYQFSQTSGGALFPDLKPDSTTVIKNLGINHCYIDQPFNASAFVASQSLGTHLTIDRCWVGSNVYLKSACAGAFLSSQQSNSAGKKALSFTLKNSFSLGTVEECYDYITEKVTETFVPGGLFGFAASPHKSNIIQNCYCANGPITNHVQVWSGGNSYYTRYENTFAVSENSPFEHEGIKYYTEEQMKGLDVLINSSKMLGLNSDNAYIAMAEDYPRIINSIGMVKISDGVTKTYVDKVINEQLNSKKIKRGYTVEIDDISSVPHYIKCSISYQDHGKSLVLEALPEDHAIKQNLLIEKVTQASLAHLEYGKYYYISVKYTDDFPFKDDTQKQNIYIDKSTYDGSGSPFIYQNNNQVTTRVPLGQEFQVDTLFILDASPEDIKSISIIPLDQASDAQFDFDNIAITLISESGTVSYPADTDGIVHGVRSVYPSLSITANAPVLITCEYIKDTPFADIIGMIIPRYLADNII